MIDGRVHDDIAKILIIIIISRFWLKKRQSLMKTKSKHLLIAI